MPIDVRIPLSVGDVAHRAGVTIATVHFYDAKGLIHGRRSKGNQRRYARDVLRRVAVIKIAQHAGIPLSVVKQALDGLPDGRTPNAKDWRDLSTKWRDMLSARIDSLMQLRDRLEGCIGCGCLSVGECPLRNPDDRLGQAGDGAVLLEQAGAADADR